MGLDYEVIRGRNMREWVLTLLVSAWRGNPDVGVPFKQIVAGFANKRLNYTVHEVELQVLDLEDTKLIERVEIETPPGWVEPDPLEKYFRPTRRGREFKAAGFPWGRIDEFAA